MAIARPLQPRLSWTFTLTLLSLVLVGVQFFTHDGFLLPYFGLGVLLSIMVLGIMNDDPGVTRAAALGSLAASLLLGVVVVGTALPVYRDEVRAAALSVVLPIVAAVLSNERRRRRAVSFVPVSLVPPGEFNPTPGAARPTLASGADESQIAGALVLAAPQATRPLRRVTSVAIMLITVVIGVMAVLQVFTSLYFTFATDYPAGPLLFFVMFLIGAIGWVGVGLYRQQRGGGGWFLLYLLAGIVWWLVAILPITFDGRAPVQLSPSLIDHLELPGLVLTLMPLVIFIIERIVNAIQNWRDRPARTPAR